MAEKESTLEKMRKREKELQDASTFELDFRRRGKSPLMDRLLGRSDFGTSMSPGAAAAEKRVSDVEWKKGKSLSEMEPTVRQAMREAALEEQREAARMGMKKGGKVKSASARADGIAQRGKTRGRIARHG